MQTEGGIRYRGRAPDRIEHAALFIGGALASSIPYRDRWEGRKLLFTGEGLKGDQTLTRGNLVLAWQMAGHFPVHVFQRRGTNSYRYLGMFRVVDYCEEQQHDKEGKLRKAYIFEILPLPGVAPKLKPLRTDEEYLAELRRLKGENRRETSRISRAKRNRLIAERLKQLYQYACQLCPPKGGIPPIPMKNGTFYVEVHHIRGFSEVAALLDESQDSGEFLIDDFENMVVLCPYHHKLLQHYRSKVRFETTSKSFVSEDLSLRIPLQLNKHFSLE